MQIRCISTNPVIILLNIYWEYAMVYDDANLEYTVRESKHSKRMQLRVFASGKVEVVLPNGSSRKAIPQFVINNREWIINKLKNLNTTQTHTITALSHGKPTQITLRAIDQHWSVTYAESHLLERIAYQSTESYALQLRGRINDRQECAKALREWLGECASSFLTPWLRNSSIDLQLPFNKVTIRGQKTRWGSCSVKKNINLNYKLLFLPPELVNYLFLHELCHTEIMNHSAQYWALVASFNPNYRQLDNALKAAGKYIPDWAHA